MKLELSAIHFNIFVQNKSMLFQIYQS